MTEIKIPSVGESITSGFIAQWHPADGAVVSEGDALLTLETDKVSTEITAEVSGKLKITVPEGEEVPIGAVVGEIEEGVGGGSGEGGEETGGVEPDAEEAAEEVAEPAGEAEAGKVEETGPEEPPSQGEPQEDKEELSPAAEAAEILSKMSPAAEKPVKLEKPEAAVKAAVKADVKADEDSRATRKKMSPLRRKIATQLVAAQRTAAILTTFNECDMGAVMTLRKQVQEGFVAKYGVKLGFMSLFIKAVVEGLKAVPAINARVDGDEIVSHNRFDIGVAVGTERGLVVPVVRDCEAKSLAEIETDIVDYATRAREGKITLEDLQGGVFTISNGGVYGSLLSTPILNPPQSGILGMHTIQERPVAIDGEVVVRPMMYLALSYDHRIVDGKEAVTFLLKVKDVIEHPAGMFL